MNEQSMGEIESLRAKLEQANDKWREEWRKHDATLAHARRLEEALRAYIESEPGIHGRDHMGLCVRCGRTEREGCNRICLLSAARAALAREHPPSLRDESPPTPFETIDQPRLHPGTALED